MRLVPLIWTAHSHISTAQHYIQCRYGYGVKKDNPGYCFSRRDLAGYQWARFGPRDLGVNVTIHQVIPCIACRSE